MPRKVFCNGTRVIVKELKSGIVEAKFITVEYSCNCREVHIQRITLDSNKSNLGFTMHRHQLPVRPTFAMRVQGQIFKKFGIYSIPNLSVHPWYVLSMSLFPGSKGRMD